VGKLRPSYREACDDYLRRLRHYGAVREIEVREAGRARSSELRRSEESDRLAAATPSGARVVALDRGGSAWSSEDLAKRLERWRDEGSTLALVIGGAFGLAPDLVERAAFRWSLVP
jgi:23S rRNA (pseudouridine1915-N3)-methyltransferase